MKTKCRLFLWAAICLKLLSANYAEGQPAITPYPVEPRNRVISPFGYGQVYQVFSTQAGKSGTAQCQAMSSTLKCLSVSGGNSCGSSVPAGQLLSCGSKAKAQVNETKFQPVNCLGHAMGGSWSNVIGSGDFCLAAYSYMPLRTNDTLYQYNDFVRLGVNRRFGGTIFELYGTDESDRILQNSGGAMQLSLWAFNPNYAPSSYPRAYYAIPSTNNSNWRTSCNPTAYSTNSMCTAANPGLTCQYGVAGPNQADCKTVFPCADNGHAAGAPLDPLQAASAGCDPGLANDTVNSVSSPAPGQLTIIKSPMNNYTFSSSFPGLTMQQTSQVQGPCAIVTYTMSNPGTLVDSDFQEIPAILLHAGANAYSYFYTGAKPYADVNGPVSGLKMSEQILFQLPNRPGPFGAGASAFLTEDWISTCDATQSQCFTVASFSSAAQDFVIGTDPGGPYAGVHGFFSITNQLQKTVEVAVCPYRFDDVVGNQTVRQYIYALHNAFLSSGLH